MPKLILSTCGTSLLTNLAGEQRGLVIRHANARTSAEVPEPDRDALTGLIAEAGLRLRAADAREQERLSAELNGLLRYYGGDPWPTCDTHWLIATDTWLGQATAEAIAQLIEATGAIVEVKRIPDLRTTDLAEFRAAMAELAKLCAEEVRGYRAARWQVVFNLTGGFKSVQGFMQALGMLYADESVYVFERTDQLLRLPRLPIALNADDLVRRHEAVFRRLAAGLPVMADQAADLDETLRMEDGGQVALSVWGDLVWAEAGPKLLGERILPPVDGRLRLGAGFERSAAECSAEERRLVNERLGDLARHLCERQYNPKRLDFKSLKVKHGPWTHECDAWSKAGAKRLFGHFEDDVFVVDALDKGLH